MWLSIQAQYAITRLLMGNQNVGNSLPKFSNVRTLNVLHVSAIIRLREEEYASHA